MHEGELALTEETAARLIAQRFPALAHEHVEASDVEWQRGTRWALQQAMGLGWYYEDSNPAMSALGLSTMNRLLDDSELTSLA